MSTVFNVIAVLGGTGSFGQVMTRFLLENTDATVRVLSRDEAKQAMMQREFAKHESRLRFILGDIRDLPRLSVALDGASLVIHAAALKQVPKAEYDPEEYIKTNIYGTQNVIHACRSTGVARALFLSTDKSVYSINSYGKTKAIAEASWIRSNSYAPNGTHYSVLRWGNITGSTGSVVPIWRHALAHGAPISITHPEMSRFYVSLNEAVALTWFAAQYAPRGTILVPRSPAYSVKTLAQAIVAESGKQWHDLDFQDIGVRPGEKLHEQLLTDDEAHNVIAYQPIENDDPLYYCIPPVAPSWQMPPLEEWSGEGHWYGHAVQTYRSDIWPWRLSVADLRQRLQEVP